MIELHQGRVGKRLPLKQGLKLGRSWPAGVERSVGKRLPLKQGLKLAGCGYYVRMLLVGKRLPLKQGLKRFAFGPVGLPAPVGKRLPLKQGLKLSSGGAIYTSGDSRKETSTKTRIETPDRHWHQRAGVRSERDFH